MKSQGKNHPSLIKKGPHCLYREFTSSCKVSGSSEITSKFTFNLYQRRKNDRLEYCVWGLWRPSTWRDKEENGKWWHQGGGSVAVIMCSGNYQSYSLRAPSWAPQHAEEPLYLHHPPQASAAAFARVWNWVYLRHPLLVTQNITHHNSLQENHTRGGPMRVQQSDVLYVFRLDCDVNDGRLMSFNQLVLLTCSLLL